VEIKRTATGEDIFLAPEKVLRARNRICDRVQPVAAQDSD